MDRLHADVQRAVGGSFNLLREISRISAHYEPGIPAELMTKRVLFLAYELETLTRHLTAQSDKLMALNRFFFETHRFSCVHEPQRLASPSFALRLNKVLSERTGCPNVLELLYAFLAERITVPLEFVDLKPTCFLKWTENGQSRYIDITRGGRTLSSDELIETLHTRFRLTGFSNAGLLDACTFEGFISDYVTLLKSLTDPVYEADRILFLQDILVSYQPSNLQLIGERALLHRRLGHMKRALADLKRYFAFHERDRAPSELVAAFDELNALKND